MYESGLRGSAWIPIIWGSGSGLEWKAGSGSASKAWLKSCWGSKLSCRGRAWRFKMKSWRVCSPVVADSQHFDEEQDPDPNPHLSEKLDPDPPKWCGSATLDYGQLRNLHYHQLRMDTGLQVPRLHRLHLHLGGDHSNSWTGMSPVTYPVKLRRPFAPFIRLSWSLRKFMQIWLSWTLGIIWHYRSRVFSFWQGRIWIQKILPDPYPDLAFSYKKICIIFAKVQTQFDFIYLQYFLKK